MKKIKTFSLENITTTLKMFSKKTNKKHANITISSFKANQMKIKKIKITKKRKDKMIKSKVRKSIQESK